MTCGMAGRFMWANGETYSVITETTVPVKAFISGQTDQDRGFLSGMRHGRGYLSLLQVIYEGDGLTTCNMGRAH